MYGEYLTALTQWANENLDIQFSSQVSYNMAMDMVREYVHNASGISLMVSSKVILKKLMAQNANLLVLTTLSTPTDNMLDQRI
jgi:hypothetical protein